MTSENTRIVQFFDFSLVSKSTSPDTSAPQKDIQFFIDNIKYLEKKSAAFNTNVTGSETFYISDIKENNNELCLLVNRSDKNMADPVFSDYANKKRRAVRKENGEGHDFSSHIVIKLNPATPNNYLCIIEKAESITTPKIVKFLNALLRKASQLRKREFEFNDHSGAKDKNNKPLKKRFALKVTFKGHLCDNFKQEINAGTLEGIELFSEADKVEYWDSVGATQEKKKVVILNVKNPGLLDNYIIFNQVSDKAKKEHLDKIKVRFTTSDKTSQTVDLYTDTKTLVNELKFVKKALIEDFERPLIKSYDKINPEIYSKIIDLI